MKGHLVICVLSALVLSTCGVSTPDVPGAKLVVDANSSTAEIVSFSILGMNAVMSGSDIIVPVPPGTSVSALTPKIVYKGASMNPGSGISQNFSYPVVYAVTAADGSVANYTVMVILDSSR
ncbi:MAG: hypothetical protein WCQ53_02390 [bacterium]